MDDEIKDLDGQIPEGETQEQDSHSDYKSVDRFNVSVAHHLSGMYKNWFLDYASYVILERAVSHTEDGLKPVRRRILHSMKRTNGGRYNKVTNTVGHTMQFYPHGDASIGDALVQLGQKDLLINIQGNWGDILTDDRTAAPRYIKVCLSKSALKTVFNPKTTEWQSSYDGRNKESIMLLVKFPLLLAQGAEGIAVGLSSKVLPYGLNDICDATISYLCGEGFNLYPDFPTGGSIDVSRYSGGQRGGALKMRAKVEKLDNKTLATHEVPFTKTANTSQESTTKIVEKGKLKIRRVEDMATLEVEIQLHLTPGTSSDKTIDAFYASTDCEINISPNYCVIRDNKPEFLMISDVLRNSAEHTKALLKLGLEICKYELEEQLFHSSLECIFIEDCTYKECRSETVRDIDEVAAFVDLKLEPYKKTLIREATRDDVIRLLEIKIQRISKFNKDKADELTQKVKTEIAEIDKDLNEMVRATIEWFTYLKEKYGGDHPRHTEIKSFDAIIAAKVVDANKKLYIDRQEGFIGTGLKKVESVQDCSDFDDVIIFYRDGKYRVIQIAGKMFVGKGTFHVQVFKKSDKCTIYNVVYRDGKTGPYYIKCFNVTSITRGKEYDVTLGTPGSKINYFTANLNGEAELIKITLDPDPDKKKQNIFMERDFTSILTKGRAAKGSLLTKESTHRISPKSHRHSILDGRKVWFDLDVNRINYEDHGRYLGEFSGRDSIPVILKNGEFYITDFDSPNHYEDNILRIEKPDADKLWTAAIFDTDNQGYPCSKRFQTEASKRHQNFTDDNPNSQMVLLTDVAFPRIQITYGGADVVRGIEEIDVEQFVGAKGFKAKGKRLTIWTVDRIEELEPARFPKEEKGDDEGNEDDIQDENSATVEKGESLDSDVGKFQQQAIDEITGQLNLSDNEQTA